MWVFAMLKRTGQPISLILTVPIRDGSGRSGVFMVVYSELEKLKVEGLVDIFQCVRTMRTRRPGIVANLVGIQQLKDIDYLIMLKRS